MTKFTCFLLISSCYLLITIDNKLLAQSWDNWKLEKENIDAAIRYFSPLNQQDSLRPAFHLTPPAGCMGDPNGGIYHDGFYHIFYGQQPFAHHPGGWYWAHARSKDLLQWEHMPNSLTPAFEYGLNAIGSGSTIVTEDDQKLAFYSQSKGGPMQFWRAEFKNDDLSAWEHQGKNPILTLEHPGLPPFDDFWRDPFVFTNQGRTFMIACADLFEEDYVPVPIFEATNPELTEWDYKGILFTYPKHKNRNFEVPEIRPLGDKWIFMASTDAPEDRCYYFLGDLDPDNLTFKPTAEGILDYSGHYYAQESILDDKGDLYLMAWMPGWDRPWLPTYMNEPLKNSSTLWNGSFALPRKLSLDERGQLIQQPVETLLELRSTSYQLVGRELPVSGPTTAIEVLPNIIGDQLEIEVQLNLHNASFCGLNVLSDSTGMGGMFINWSGNLLNVDGVKVPMDDWQPGENIRMQIFIDQNMVEVFVNGGRYCISRQVRREHIAGNRVALTSLGGTAKLVGLKAWDLKKIMNDEY